MKTFFLTYFVYKSLAISGYGFEITINGSKTDSSEVASKPSAGDVLSATISHGSTPSTFSLEMQNIFGTCDITIDGVKVAKSIHLCQFETITENLSGFTGTSDVSGVDVLAGGFVMVVDCKVKSVVDDGEDNTIVPCEDGMSWLDNTGKTIFWYHYSDFLPKDSTEWQGYLILGAQGVMDLATMTLEFLPLNLDCVSLVTHSGSAAFSLYWLWFSALYDTSVTKYYMAIASTAA